jgi:hypothetical protein
MLRTSKVCAMDHGVEAHAISALLRFADGNALNHAPNADLASWEMTDVQAPALVDSFSRPHHYR